FARFVQVYNSPSVRIEMCKPPLYCMKRFQTRGLPFKYAEQMSVSKRKLTRRSPFDSAFFADGSIPGTHQTHPRPLPRHQTHVGDLRQAIACSLRLAADSTEPRRADHQASWLPAQAQ